MIVQIFESLFQFLKSNHEKSTLTLYSDREKTEEGKDGK